MSGAPEVPPPHKSVKNVLNVTILKVFRNESDPPFQRAVKGFKHTYMLGAFNHTYMLGAFKHTYMLGGLKHTYKLGKHTYTLSILSRCEEVYWNIDLHRRLDPERSEPLMHLCEWNEMLTVYVFLWWRSYFDHYSHGDDCAHRATITLHSSQAISASLSAV